MKLLHAILIFILALSDWEKQQTNQLEVTRNFRQNMRYFVINISEYAKNRNPKFAIVPQNGIALVTLNGETNSQLGF